MRRATVRRVTLQPTCNRGIAVSEDGRRTDLTDLDIEGLKPGWQQVLDKIPVGAGVLVHVALDRVDDVRRALEEGRFSDAEHHTNELIGKLRPLAHAEATLGSFADRTSVVRAKDLREGMHVYGWGDVKDIALKHCESQAGEQHDHVLITIDGESEPREVSDLQELMVQTQSMEDGPHGE